MNILLEMLKEIGLPYVYSHWAQGEIPPTPYICYMMSGSNPFSADGRVYFNVIEIDLELYTDKPDKESQKKILDVLDRHNIFYGVTETWIPDQGLYQTWVTFELEV